MENQNGTRTKAIAEFRQFRALIDDVVGALRRRLRSADEEEDKIKALEMRKQISKDQDEFKECMDYIQGKIKETNSDASKEAS